MAGLDLRLVAVAHDLRRGASAAALSAFADLTGELIDELGKSGSRAAELTPIIELALAAQERADYLGLADLLEYELAPGLTQA